MRVIILVCLLLVVPAATAKHPLKIFHGASNYQECLEKSKVPDTPFSRRLWVSTKAVIEAFKQDDPRPLWAMINFPLISGPLESELLSGKISDWFEPEIYQRVVSADPICRGFLLLVRKNKSFIFNGLQRTNKKFTSRFFRSCQFWGTEKSILRWA